MNAVDTIVLLYLHDPRDARKQEVAAGLVNALPDGVLLWQVACEYLAAAHKLYRFGVERAHVLQSIEDLHLGWRLVRPDWEVLSRAFDWVNRYSVAFWDAMIVSACFQAGVSTLYSEDINSSMVPSDGITIVNPF